MKTVSIGDKFGRLTVSSHVFSDKKYHKRVSLICDCGNKHNSRVTHLINGNVKSCGCLLIEVSKKPKLHLRNDSTAFNKVLASYKKHSKNRGYSFDLSSSEFKELISRECHYCGVKKSNKCTTRLHSFEYNGVDRVDNNKGYSIDNCVTCCSDCNKAKMALGYDEFLDLVKRIYKKHFK